MHLKINDTGKYVEYHGQTNNKPIHSRSQIGNFIKKTKYIISDMKTKPTIEEINTRRESAMPKKQKKTKDIVKMMWSHCGGLDCGE